MAPAQEAVSEEAADAAESASLHLDDDNDPLFGYKPLPFMQDIYPLGFRITLQSNNADLLDIARSSWPGPNSPHKPTNIRLLIGVYGSGSKQCPPAPILRAQGHLLTSICDAQSFITCDLQDGYAFGWLSSTVLRYPDFLRYHLLDAAMMTLLTTSYLTPVHAACVSFNGRGILLHGSSGAGKSTLAYACARAGWTYTTDDASYLLRDDHDLRVRGRHNLIRFRPSARQLFPELEGLSITPRMQGKPSIEVSTERFPSLKTAAEAPIHAFVALDRSSTRSTCLAPLSSSQALASLQESIFPLPSVHERQRIQLQRLLRAKMFTLHYQDLDRAIATLETLAQGLHA